MPKLDVSTQTACDDVDKLIEEVLHNVHLRVGINLAPEDNNSPVGVFLTKLRERPNLHFF